MAKTPQLRVLDMQQRSDQSAALDAALPATLLFDYPTLGELVAFLYLDILKLEEAGKAETKKAAKETDTTPITENDIRFHFNCR